jgi:hypothetical protein
MPQYKSKPYDGEGYGSKSLSASAIRDLVDSLVPGLYNAQPGVQPIDNVHQLDTKDRAKFRRLARAEHARYN